jgi:dTMP kinase
MVDGFASRPILLVPWPGYDGSLVSAPRSMPVETTPRMTQPHPHPGLFLALEGPDGGGKTTQAERLADWLREEESDIVVTCRDPGSTEVGDRLRGIVLERNEHPLSMRSEMLVYMASRAQLVDQVIRPSMAASRIVITDRFLLSNIVYQGYAGGLPMEEIWTVGRIATDSLLPDLTLVLDVPVDVTRSRVGSGRDRIEDRPLDYQQRVRDGFIDAARFQARTGELCPYYPAPVVLIDASTDPDLVFEQIKKEVERVLALGPRP